MEISQSDAEREESVAPIALSIRQRNLASKRALNMGKNFYSRSRKPVCANSA